MKKILIPVDFSACSLNAVRYAIHLHPKEPIHLQLLHAYPLAQGLDIPDHYLEQKRESWEQDALVQYEMLKRQVAPLTLHTHVLFSLILAPGGLTPEIINTAEREASDIVIMGTQGAHGLQKFFAGSHTSQIISRVSCPVLVVPEHYNYQEIHTIVYATDCQPQDIEALKEVVALAEPTQARIVVLHIETRFNPLKALEHFQWYQERIKSEISYKAMTYDWLEGRNIQKALERYLGESQADLIVMLTQNRPWIDQLFHQSHTKEMAEQTTVPLWAFSAKAMDALQPKEADGNEQQPEKIQTPFISK